MCEVDVIANSLVLYLPFCSTLNKNFFSLSLFFSRVGFTFYLKSFVISNLKIGAIYLGLHFEYIDT